MFTQAIKSIRRVTCVLLSMSATLMAPLMAQDYPAKPI